jgi:hypothetical protein
MKSLLILLVFLAILVETAAQEGESITVNDSLATENIEHAYGNREFNRAKVLLENFIKKYNVESSAGLSYAMANIEFAREDFEAARKSYATCIKLTGATDPNLEYALIGLERSEQRLRYIKNASDNTKVKDPLSIQFQIVDQVPIYPGCEMKSTTQSQKSCLQEGLAMEIKRNYNTEVSKETGFFGNIKIDCFFTIGEDGKIKDIKVQSLNPQFEHEALRLLKNLPQMKPGKQSGKAVEVAYTLPIVFSII